jgi:hypothetical protein
MMSRLYVSFLFLFLSSGPFAYGSAGNNAVASQPALELSNQEVLGAFFTNMNSATFAPDSKCFTAATIAKHLALLLSHDINHKLTSFCTKPQSEEWKCSLDIRTGGSSNVFDFFLIKSGAEYLIRDNIVRHDLCAG